MRRFVQEGQTQRPLQLKATSAVLPFVNLGLEPDSAYLSEGITEELIGALSAIDGLQVASRTAVFAIDPSGMGPSEIGDRLGVGHIVEGSVRRDGDRLRVQTTLVGVSDGFPLWSTRFDVSAAEVFAVQDSIARAVATSLDVAPDRPGEVIGLAGGTRDVDAQDLYFKGRYAWNRRTPEGLARAVAYFDSAVMLDPGYARALTGLGDAWAVMGFYDYMPPTEAFPRAQESARQALAIDSTLAEPYATLGYAALYHDFDWAEAEAYFRRSIALDPGYPVAHQWYANFLTARGRFPEARAEMRLASELDPLSSIAFAAIGWVSYYAGDYELALEELDEALARDPDFVQTHLWRAGLLSAMDRHEEALESARRAVGLSGGNALARTMEARVVALAGDPVRGGDLLRALEEEGDGLYLPSYELARAWVGVGDPDRALEWLERAAREKAHSLAFLEVDPELSPLRGEPRFEVLRERLQL